MSANGDWIDDDWWAAVAGHPLHPAQLEIVEAVAWIERPVSPAELSHVFSGEYGLAQIAYHMRRLCDLGLFELEEEVQTRGALVTTYRPASLE